MVLVGAIAWSVLGSGSEGVRSPLTPRVEAQASSGDTISVRIIARRNSDGRTEFGMRDAAGRQYLPPARYFPAVGPDHNNWLQSTEIDFGDGYAGRIIARRAPDGRVEFGFRVEGYQDILPPARYFPRRATVNQWLVSSWIEIARPAASQVARSTKLWDLAVALHQFGEELRYAYNDYGNCPDGWNCTESSDARAGYQGGHSGWDSYRYSQGTRKHGFHSLTEGTIVCLRDSYGQIAIKDSDGYITRYLHGVRSSHLSVGDSVEQYQRIGTTDGLGAGGAVTFRLHVHVEVSRPGTPACDILDGASDSYAVDPVNYLYDNWIGN